MRRVAKPLGRLTRSVAVAAVNEPSDVESQVILSNRTPVNKEQRRLNGRASLSGRVAVVKARLPSSFFHTKTSAVRPIVVPRALHRTTTRSALQRTPRQPARLFDQQSVEETELRTGKTTTNQREGSVRCQFWRQFCPCLARKAGDHLWNLLASQNSSSAARPERTGSVQPFRRFD